MEYYANGGQTYLPFLENTHVDTLPYTPLERPQPPLPDLELNDAARAKGWVLNAQHQHVLPGVTAAMLDWWWANMEKGYYLWAPGSHKRFSWVREPWKYGFVHSAHMISESVGKDAPVFGGSGVQIDRLDLSWFPFTTHLEHVICEGIFNGKGEFVDATIHMWQDCPGGCVHMDAAAGAVLPHMDGGVHKLPLAVENTFADHMFQVGGEGEPGQVQPVDLHPAAAEHRRVLPHRF